MTNVLYITTRLKKAGPNNQLLYIVNNLDRNMYHPTVLSLLRTKDREYARQFCSMCTAEVIPLDRRGTISVMALVSRVRREVRRLRIGLVHTQGLIPDMISILVQRTPARISTLRNVPYKDYPLAFGWIGYPMAWVHLLILKLHPFVAACSDSVRRGVSHLFKSSVVMNGVDTSEYVALSSADRQSSRAELGYDESNIVLLSASPLIARKNVARLVDLFNSYSPLHPTARLLVLGDGPQRETLEATSRTSVVLLGHRNDVGSFMGVADIVVSLSKAEGLPNTALEALACGNALLLSRIPSHVELAQYLPEAPIFFVGRAGQGFSRAVSAASSARLTGDALRAVRDRIGAARMSAEYQRLYRLIVS